MSDVLPIYRGQTVKCCECGRFISYADMDAGLAKFEYVPDCYMSREELNWTCHVCIHGTKERKP